MELRHLRYFVAVADEQHVTRASERLGIQQAPLSQQIKALETELGVQLFRRKARGVELTDAGRALHLEARAILARVGEATILAQRVARGEQGHLRIGFTNSACFHPFLPRALRAFGEAFPGIALSFAQGSTPALIADLQGERIDAAFLRTAVAHPEGLSLHPLLVEPMVAALPAGHPLAGEVTALNLAAMATEIFIAYPRSAGAGLYDAIIAACHGAGFSPRIGHEAPQIVATLNLVAAGLGVAIVPDSLRRLSLDGVVYRALDPTSRPMAELSLAVRRGEPSAAVGRLTNLVIQRARAGED